MHAIINSKLHNLEYDKFMDLVNLYDFGWVVYYLFFEETNIVNIYC